MNWNANLYDDKHAFVFKYGEDLVELLKPQQREKILDLGCGTGYLTNIIASGGADVIGIDNSIEMIAKARASYPQIDFYVQSATSFHFEDHFDAVFSNAVLHWISDKEKVVSHVFEYLKRNGRFVLEMGGKHNVNKIIRALQKSLIKNGYEKNAATQPWYFPSLGEYTSLLEANGFRVVYAIYYDRETKLNDKENGIKDWIKMFAPAYLNGLEEDKTEEILSEVQDTLAPTHFREGCWYADYKRLRVVAIKQIF